MKLKYMLFNNGISIQSFPTRKEAERLKKEWEDYHADGRKYSIEEVKQPETIRDIEALCGIASKDRPLTVNGRPFRVMKTESGGINLTCERNDS